MSTTHAPPQPSDLADGAGGGFVADDLARASFALARRFSVKGTTMWCASRAWPFHAHHVAVEFVHPVIVGKRALAAVALPPGAEVAPTLRACVRDGDIVCALAPADDAEMADALRRARAWGVETVWIGHGPRPRSGAADHLLWLDTADPLEASEQFVRIYHMLWELTHVCFEHPGLMKSAAAAAGCDESAGDGAVCITCSDEGRLGEVLSVLDDEALVRTAEGEESVDISLLEPPAPGDLILVHAGVAIGPVLDGGEG